MDKKRTNKNITYNALNSYFLNTETMQINKEWLEHHLDITIFNNRWIYEKMQNKRTKSRSIVWCGLMQLADDCIKEIEAPNNNYYASSDQLKKWLDEYGSGFDTLANMVAYVEKYRQEEL